jgi:hypothetical protein
LSGGETLELRRSATASRVRSRFNAQDMRTSEDRQLRSTRGLRAGAILRQGGGLATGKDEKGGGRPYALDARRRAVACVN